jgi:hypothetical protein
MRRHYAIASALSLALCAATLALWARSYKFYYDAFKNSVWDHDGQRVVLRGSQSDFACTRVQWRLGIARGRLIVSRSVDYSKNEFRPDRITNYLWVSRPLIAGHSEVSGRLTEPPDAEPNDWSFAGFGGTRDNEQTRGRRGNIVQTYHIDRLQIPCWGHCGIVRGTACAPRDTVSYTITQATEKSMGVPRLWL